MPKRFDPARLHRLDDPRRLDELNPEVLWRTAELTKPKVLVEIGAGTGLFAREFAKRLKKGTVYAADVSDEMLAALRTRTPEELRNSIVPVKCTPTSVPLPARVADMVYTIDVHHELNSPLDQLQEAKRLLRRGGRLMIVDWKKAETPHGPKMSLRVDEDAICAQVARAGFVNVISHDVLPYHNVVTARRA